MERAAGEKMYRGQVPPGCLAGLVAAIVLVGLASVCAAPYMPDKRFKLRGDEIRPLTPGRGGCYATDHITVEGHRVGYMYRELAEGSSDSGWRFFSGLETDEYANDPQNLEIYDVNTIANYDPEIIPLLDAPAGTAFARDGATGKFVAEALTPPEG